MVDIVLVSNLKSGLNKKDKENRRIKGFRKIIGNKGKVYVTGKTNDFISELELIAQEISIHKPAVCYTDSGDGGAAFFLSALERYWDSNFPFPVIGITGGGSFNAISKKVGVKNPNKELKSVIKAQNIEDLALEDVHMIRSLDESNRSYLCFTTGTGVVPHLIKEVEKAKHLKYFQVFKIFSRLFFSGMFDGKYYQGFNKKKRMIVNGIEDDWLGVSVHSIKSFGLPPRIEKWNKLLEPAEKSLDRFMYFATTMNMRRALPWTIFSYFDPEISLSNSSKDRYVKEQTSELLLQSNTPFLYQINGEISDGYEPLLTKELCLTQGKVFKFTKGAQERGK